MNSIHILKLTWLWTHNGKMLLTIRRWVLPINRAKLSSKERDVGNYFTAGCGRFPPVIGWVHGFGRKKKVVNLQMDWGAQAWWGEDYWIILGEMVVAKIGLWQQGQERWRHKRRQESDEEGLGRGSEEWVTCEGEGREFNFGQVEPC